MNDVIKVSVQPHRLLDAGIFATVFPTSLGRAPCPDWLRGLLRLAADAPFASDDNVRARVRDLLRHGGFKPTGRSKPASEYLIKAAEGGFLGSINLAVDACNAVSLHSGLPISVVDLDRVQGPLSIRTASSGETYVFNASGQTIDVAGLLCLCDERGPCANAVKDAQRTKTTPETTRTLSVVWGTAELPDRTAKVTLWYRELLERAGAHTEAVQVK